MGLARAFGCVGKPGVRFCEFYLSLCDYFDVYY